MTIKLIPEFWRNLEIPEKLWKTYEQVKMDLFQIFNLFLISFLIPEFFHPDQPPYHPTIHPTILLDILCLANLNKIISFSFLGFPKTKHEEINILNLC